MWCVVGDAFVCPWPTVSSSDSSFFFQAEDGIRDYKVTGVQTCALPIYAHEHHRARLLGNERLHSGEALVLVWGGRGLEHGGVVSLVEPAALVQDLHDRDRKSVV